MWVGHTSWSFWSWSICGGDVKNSLYFLSFETYCSFPAKKRGCWHCRCVLWFQGVSLFSILGVPMKCAYGIWTLKDCSWFLLHGIPSTQFHDVFIESVSHLLACTTTLWIEGVGLPLFILGVYTWASHCDLPSKSISNIGRSKLMLISTVGWDESHCRNYISH